MSASWVRRLKPRQKATGSLAPHDVRMRELVRAAPDATLAELRQRLGLKVGISALSEYRRRIA